MVKVTLSFLALAVFPALAMDPVPDFSAQDKNDTSSRFEELISPRDYRHQVSAYYFGQAT